MAVHPTRVHKAGLNIHERIVARIAGLAGSPYAFYISSLLALVSLPAVLTQAGVVPLHFFPSWLVAIGLIALVAWIAQTFIQLVMLFVLQADAQLSGKHSEQVAQAIYDNAVKAEKVAEEILDMLERLDVKSRQ